MTTENAFVVLGIAPTIDVSLIKRAYFAALAKTPPHVDPEGFRRLRKAYDELLLPATRALAFLRAPADDQPELAHWEERFGARVRHAQAEGRRAALASKAADRFIERVSRMRLEDVLSQRAFSVQNSRSDDS